jgi:hypothetical protein
VARLGEKRRGRLGHMKRMNMGHTNLVKEKKTSGLPKNKWVDHPEENLETILIERYLQSVKDGRYEEVTFLPRERHPECGIVSRA